MSSLSRRSRPGKSQNGVEMDLEHEFDNITDMRTRDDGIREYKVTCTTGEEYHEKWTSLPSPSVYDEILVKVFHSGIKFANHPNTDELVKDYKAAGHPKNLNLVRQLNQLFEAWEPGDSGEECIGNILARRKTKNGNAMYFVVWLGCDNHFEWKRESHLNNSKTMVNIFESGVKFAEKQKNLQETNAGHSSRASGVSNNVEVTPGTRRVSDGATAGPCSVTGAAKKRKGRGKPEEAPLQKRVGQADCSDGGNSSSGTGENDTESILVTVTLANPPHRDLTTSQEKEFGKLMKIKVLTQVLNGAGGVIPAMAGMKRVEDRLTVKCCNPETANWLIQVVSDLGHGMFKGWLEPPPEVVQNYSTFIPETEDLQGNPLTIDFVRNVIRIQNPCLRPGIDQWQFSQVNAGDKGDVSGTWLKVGIPEKLVPSLKEIEASDLGISFGIDKLDRFEVDV